MIICTRNISLNLARNLIQSRTIFSASLNKCNGKLLRNISNNNVIRNNSTKDGNEKEENSKPLNFPAFPLNETLETFLKSVAAIHEGKEYEESEEDTHKFQNCEGPILQELLLAEAAKSDNWLAERWLRTAYLQYRDPVCIYSSPGMTFPQHDISTDDDWLEYASKVIYFTLKFKSMVDDNKIPVQKMGKYVLDNSQYHQVFGTCRIPGIKEDTLSYNPYSKHIVVIYKNYFYKVDICTTSGKSLTPAAIKKQLYTIKDGVDNESGSPIEMGILTLLDRNTWARTYADIMHIVGNSDAIEDIQAALFTVSLDKNNTDGCDIPQDESVAHQLIHGGGSLQNSCNRWMDKTIQLIINRNGMGGFCYEHSPAEGQPIAIMTDYIVSNICKYDKDEECLTDEEVKDMEKNRLTLLKINADMFITETIREAKKIVDKLIKNLDVKVLHFKYYGKGFLKQQKLSPDSYIQMALQLAFYSIYKVPGVAYESAHLRMYICGRTETIRSCSVESMEFVKAMDSNADKEIKATLLRAAVDGHRKYTSMALQGRGADRHLLGLKLMAIENKMPIPEFYSSKAYTDSCYFRLSTSQVASKNHSFMAYGPLVPNGYGCCYNPREEDIFFAISSWDDNAETSSQCFYDALSKALCDMMELLHSVDSTPKAKM